MDDALFSSPPDRSRLVETTAEDPLGGPSYSYRGAVIDCQKGGHVCRLLMPGHPPNGRGFGVVRTITRLVSLWVAEGRLPHHMRAVSKVRAKR